jgi:hypothetical protein
MINTLRREGQAKMSSSLLADTQGDVLRSALEGAGEGVLVVRPCVETVDRLVSAAVSLDSPPSLRLLAEGRTLKTATDDFLVASNAADLVENGVLELRTLTDEVYSTLLITDDAVLSLVEADGAIAALSTADDAFVERARVAYGARWEAADPHALGTPPLSRVRETLADAVGERTRDDFDALLEAFRADGDGLDEVTASLLAAAKNDVLLYDISKWGEDVGIASKATFSRTKTNLEKADIVDTEKVPIDVGRPRLRLKLGDDRLKGASADRFAAVVRDLLD